jgi:hypothetical protein
MPIAPGISKVANGRNTSFVNAEKKLGTSPPRSEKARLRLRPLHSFMLLRFLKPVRPSERNKSSNVSHAFASCEFLRRRKVLISRVHNVSNIVDITNIRPTNDRSEGRPPPIPFASMRDQAILGLYLSEIEPIRSIYFVTLEPTDVQSAMGEETVTDLVPETFTAPCPKPIHEILPSCTHSCCRSSCTDSSFHSAS